MAESFPARDTGKGGTTEKQNIERNEKRTNLGREVDKFSFSLMGSAFWERTKKFFELISNVLISKSNSSYSLSIFLSMS